MKESSGRKRVLVIGGGASGLMAAVTAARYGASVTVLEHGPKAAKKILSTGNGKCNLTNLYWDSSCYRGNQENFPTPALKNFSPKAALSFFGSIGVLTVEKAGYVYPMSGQAQVVRDALIRSARSLGVTIVTDCTVKSLNKTGNGFAAVCEDGTVYEGDSLILACGSMAAKSTGSDGSGYDLARRFGHRIIKPLPALVQLRCKDSLLFEAAGVRADGKIRLFSDDGHLLAQETGELQITDYGISGIPVFQVSRFAAGALDKKKGVTACIRFLPGLEEKKLTELLKKQRDVLFDETAEAFLNGFFHKKLADVLLKTAKISPQRKSGQMTERELEKLADTICHFTLSVTGTNSFDQAQVCAGGVDTEEIDPLTMQSKKLPGLYIVGELLDVDGICGGYNLQWAWASGYAAGSHSSRGTVPEFLAEHQKNSMIPLNQKAGNREYVKTKRNLTETTDKQFSKSQSGERKQSHHDSDQSIDTSRRPRGGSNQKKGGKAPKNRRIRNR